MRSENLDLSSLTPIWTGDEDGKADRRIRETSILGGLRWWMEVFARGVGARVPDPVTTHPIFNRLSGATGGLDPVCQVFGATGWRRRFRLIVNDSTKTESLPGTIRFATAPHARRGKMVSDSEWFFNSFARDGQFRLEIIPLPGFDPSIISGLVYFASHWASLGARSQMGFGQVHLATGVSSAGLRTWLSETASTHTELALPSLDSMFFAEIRFKSSGKAVSSKPDMFVLKHDLRRLFPDPNLRHAMMGEVDSNKRCGSRISMSFPFGDPKSMRVWGWVPKGTPGREVDVLDRIHRHLYLHYDLSKWREFGAPTRDKSSASLDRLAFALSLLD